MLGNHPCRALVLQCAMNAKRSRTGHAGSTTAKPQSPAGPAAKPRSATGDTTVSARSPRARRKRTSPGPDAWLEAARAALIEEGTAGVEINKLAKRLGCSRSSFYWFFEDR